jgi:sugar phosphate isomerase/epimerase
MIRYFRAFFIRRTILKWLIVFTSTLWIGGNAVYAQKNPLGLIASLDNDSLLYHSGFKITGATVATTIGPALSEEEFQATLAKIKRAKVQLYVCNVLFPGSIKIAGSEVDETKVLSYLEQVLTRAKRAGIKNITLGSGGARRLSDSDNRTAATTQFILLAGKMAKLAERYDVTIILENLNSGETNFINRLSDAADIVKKVNHKNFRLNADIYHMMKEDESPDEIVKAGNIIVYCELAEKQNRSLPGVNKDDFRPYLQALKKISYKGPIMIEASSTNLQKEVPGAFTYLKGQLSEVWKKN